jgi:hypothetical protein
MEPTDFPFAQQRSTQEDPQPGDRVKAGQGKVVRRVVSRDGSRVGYVSGAGLGTVQWCELLAWQLWCDASI